jgi:hypothetical protein
MDADVNAARQRLSQGGVTEADVAEFDSVFRERFWLLQTLFRCTADLRHSPGSFDIRHELERRALLPLAPAHVKFAGTAKPRLQALWEAPLLRHLEAYREAREQAARATTAAAHARRAAEQRPGHETMHDNTAPR